MQGIVGMLDVMYATVQEAVETQADPRIKKVFETLKNNIEVVHRVLYGGIWERLAQELAEDGSIVAILGDHFRVRRIAEKQSYRFGHL